MRIIQNLLPQSAFSLSHIHTHARTHKHCPQAHTGHTCMNLSVLSNLLGKTPLFRNRWKHTQPVGWQQPITFLIMFCFTTLIGPQNWGAETPLLQSQSYWLIQTHGLTTANHIPNTNWGQKRHFSTANQIGWHKPWLCYKIGGKNANFWQWLTCRHKQAFNGPKFGGKSDAFLHHEIWSGTIRHLPILLW